jgi:hypothetical protein
MAVPVRGLGSGRRGLGPGVVGATTTSPRRGPGRVWVFGSCRNHRGCGAACPWGRACRGCLRPALARSSPGRGLGNSAHPSPLGRQGRSGCPRCPPPSNSEASSGAAFSARDSRCCRQAPAEPAGRGNFRNSTAVELGEMSRAVRVTKRTSSDASGVRSRASVESRSGYSLFRCRRGSRQLGC